jgi:5-methylcytosine-specific restriction endonuclease McrA
MRGLPSRPDLPPGTTKKLAARTQAILTAGDKPTAAKSSYQSARVAKWFAPVVDALKATAGPSGSCMYCSCNEPSEIDHYRPISLNPERALLYSNYVWVCGVCNRAKGDRFPPETEVGAEIVNPIDDSVWVHFFLDPEYGRLMPVWDAEANDFDARGKSTCEVVGIDRQYVQDRRRARLHRMRRDAKAALSGLEDGATTPDDIAALVQEWLTDPEQPDVADYFLRGPGAGQEPFAQVLKAAQKHT